MEIICKETQKSCDFSSESLFGDEFSVDDLLDLGDITDVSDENEEITQKGEDAFLLLDYYPDTEPVSELVLPAHDVADLEWVSRMIDDTQSEFPPAPPAKTPTEMTSVTRRSRTKRGRGSNGCGWGPLETSSSTSSSSTPSSSSCCSYSSPLIFSSHPPPVPLLMGPGPHAVGKKMKKRGRRPRQVESEAQAKPVGERRCSHCGVNKTPQWRAGPNGAKTLCNACGVRYKSGRLLPEYRPAGSPTFVSHIHSNSHRKVLEMRRKKSEDDEGVLMVYAPQAQAVATF